MISLFKLIKEANTKEHVIRYDAFVGFDDTEPVKEESKASYSLDDLDHEKNLLLKEIEALQQKAAAILEEAETQARTIREAAEQRGYDAGYARGYDEGMDKGFEEAVSAATERVRAESRELLDDLKKLIEYTEQRKEEILGRYQDDLKDVAIAVAEKVVHVSLRSSGDVIKRMILSATEGIQKKEWAKIYISKTDSQLLLQGDADLINEISHLSDHIKIIVMEEEASGSCIIELPDKVLDAGANTQLTNIREILSSGRR